jgi:prevent-host-death family protein
VSRQSTAEESALWAAHERALEFAGERTRPPPSLPQMVIMPILMTMSSKAHRWSVASAKAELSRVLDEAQRRPQVIERRGKPIAVVVAADRFEDTSATERWRKFLAVSAEVRAAGGGELHVPRRHRRRSPFAASR